MFQFLVGHEAATLIWWGRNPCCCWQSLFEASSGKEVYTSTCWRNLVDVLSPVSSLRSVGYCTSTLAENREVFYLEKREEEFMATTAIAWYSRPRNNPSFGRRHLRPGIYSGSEIYWKHQMGYRVFDYFCRNSGVFPGESRKQVALELNISGSAPYHCIGIKHLQLYCADFTW